MGNVFKLNVPLRIGLLQLYLTELKQRHMVVLPLLIFISIMNTRDFLVNTILNNQKIKNVVFVQIITCKLNYRLTLC